MISRVQFVAISLLLFPIPALAGATLEDGNNFSWSENIGWINWSVESATPVAICPSVLSGFIWSANCGWINLGDGSPEDGLHYSNSSKTDYGVNHDGEGNLSGYAYGENIGWINFDGSSTGGDDARVTIDLVTGKLNGYAWGENIGWINFTDSTVITDPDFLQSVSLDSNEDGVVNAEDLIHHLETGNPCRNCRDWALDFAVRWRKN